MRSIGTGALCALSLFGLPNLLHGQDPKPRNHGYETFMKGLELEQQDDLAGAVTLYGTVHPNDSVHERVLLRQINVLYRLDRHAEILPLSERGIAMNGEQAHLFLLNRVIAMHELKRYDEAMALLDIAEQRYPGFYHVHSMRVATLESKGDLKGAVEAAKRNAVHFPLTQEAHMALGNLAQREGKTTQAALAYFMALCTTWNNERSERALIRVDELLNGNLDDDPKDADFGPGDDFSELDLLLKNKVAMSKGYKLKPNVEYPSIRQGHFLLTTLQAQEPGAGFWNTYYLPFFKQLMERGQFEAFAYHILGNSSNEKVKAHYNKNKALVEQWRKGLMTTFNEFYTTFPDSLNGQVKPLFHLYNEDQNLLAKGEGDASKDLHVGEWIFYGDNGAMSVRGRFNSEHHKDGEWTAYFDNGRTAKVNHWENDKENGPFLTWHRNGVPKDSTAVVDGKGHGPYTEFWNTGRIRSRKTFVNGDLTGPVSYYYACGAKEYAAELVDDELKGDVKALSADGKLQYSGTFVDGEPTGEIIRYHRNGNKASSYMYAAGERSGPYTEWYANGAKQREGSYAKDKPTGKVTEWYADGTLRSEGEYDAQGREAGVARQYNPDGTLYNEFETRNGLLVRYKYMDRSGKQLVEAKRAKGRFQFVGYTPDGAKMMEGSYLDEGAKDGPWKWFWPDGTVMEEEQLKNGEENGTRKRYRECGQLLRESRYLPGKGRTGPYTEYWPDGSAQVHGYVQNGELNGESKRLLPNGTMVEDEYFVDGLRSGWQRYFDMDGVPYYDEYLDDGFVREFVEYDTKGVAYNRVVMPHGAFAMETKYPDGRPESRVEYMNMVRHGKAKWTYPDGSALQEGNYFNGEMHGLWRAWHPNGKPRSERTYDMGDLTGTAKQFRVDGTIESEETYEDGLTVHFKEFHQNGKQMTDRPRRSGSEHGTTTSWNMNGELQLLRYFQDGRMLGYSYHGADGKPLDTIPLGEGLVDLRPKYPNGSPSREMTYRNGELHGTYKEFYSDGKLMEVANFECGHITGKGVEYWPNGKIASTTNWQYGVRHGENVDHWDNGQPMDKCQWVFGARHGERTLFDRTGKPTLIIVYRNDGVISMRKP